MSHICSAKHCNVSVPDRLLMCRKHWFLVPRAIQAEVWAHYRKGQEFDRQCSESYLKAQQKAIDAVAKIEGVEM